MKKFILLFSLIIVFILSLIINFDNPAISITLSAKSDNIQPPKINVSQKNTKNENIDFYSILPLSDCNLIIGLKNYESSFQRKLLGNFAVIISGSERTSELTRQDIVLPLNNGMSAEIAVIKHNPFLWNYLGVIYKFILLFFSFALVYGISLISVNHKDEILSFLNKDWPHEIAVFARNVKSLVLQDFPYIFCRNEYCFFVPYRAFYMGKP